MLTIRKSRDRGFADHGWLKSRHTFSFARYHDEKHMGFGVLRVINEDRIAGGKGFGAHSHRDMEIISYVIEGSLEHSDSMGNKGVIRPGEVQRMSAGTGVEHAEMNHEAEQTTHFFQIWVTPQKTGLEPSYGQKDFSQDLAQRPLVLVVSPDGRDGSIAINQDASLFIARLKPHASLHFGLEAQRQAWVQVVKGQLAIQGEKVEAGDGVAISKERVFEVLAESEVEVLIFDLPEV